MGLRRAVATAPLPDGAGHTAPSPDAAAWFLALLDAVGSGPIGAAVRQCPAHNDGAPSLSVGTGQGGKLLLQCHAGCTWKDILGALGLPAKYLNAPPPVDPAAYARAFCPELTFPPVAHHGHPSSRGFRFEAEHAYGDRWRMLRYRHPVTGAKEVSWEALNDKGEWVPGLLGTPTRDLPLYFEQQVRMAVGAGEPVLVVESESSADALVYAGFYATTWAGGAASVQLQALRRVLLGHPYTVVVPDHDEPGLRALAAMRNAQVAPHVLMPAGGEDARDLLVRVGREEFRGLVDEALQAPAPSAHPIPPEGAA